MFEKIMGFITSFFSGEPGAGTVLLVKTVHSPDGKHRVRFFHRKEDGVCGFREEVFEDRTIDACWVPMTHGHIEEYRSMDEAVAAARAGIPWLHGAMP